MENDGGPGEVAGVLERTDDEEQDEDLRDEGEERADAGEDRVLDEVVREPDRESPPTTPPAAATPTLTSAISGAAQVKMAWKRIAITTKKTGRPNPVERNSRSSRS